MNKERGLLIVFEGLDRCGKSTQVKLLHDYLKNQGKQVSTMNFPDRTTIIGGVIQNYLSGNSNMKDEVIHQLFSANRWEKFNEMIDTLQKGTHIICDRYSYSGVAFSSAKGLPFQWCKGSDSGLIKPDLILYFQAPMNILSQRGDYGKERYENREFQNKVRIQFDILIESEKMQLIKADDTIQKVFLDKIKICVHENVVEIVLKKLHEETPDIKYLWNDIFTENNQQK